MCGGNGETRAQGQEWACGAGRVRMANRVELKPQSGMRGLSSLLVRQALGLTVWRVVFVSAGFVCMVFLRFPSANRALG